LIDIFTLAPSQVVPDIGINMDKLDGVKWITEKNISAVNQSVGL